MLSFFEKTVNFSRTTGGANEQRVTVDISRPNPSNNSRVLINLKGYDIRYKGEDHHLLRTFIRQELDDFGPFNSSVNIKVTLGLRDSSGNWDDPYEGSVTLGIIVIDDDRFDIFEGNRRFSYRSGVGPRSEIDFLQLNDPSEQGIVLLQGFDIGYERKDHHVLLMNASVNSQVIPVGNQRYDAVQCSLGLRDSSNFWDDPYGGAVYYSVLRYPKGLIEFVDGRLSGSGHNQGPVRKNTSHFIQENISNESIYVGMTGFSLSYTGGDHHVHRLVNRVGISNVTSEAERTKIDITCEGGIRDKSGNWDDQYAFDNEYVVLAVPPAQEITAIRWPYRIIEPIYSRRGYKFPTPIR
jgi:hypothetical protein